MIINIDFSSTDSDGEREDSDTTSHNSVTHRDREGTFLYTSCTFFLQLCSWKNASSLKFVQSICHEDVLWNAIGIRKDMLLTHSSFCMTALFMNIFKHFFRKF